MEAAKETGKKGAKFDAKKTEGTLKASQHVASDSQGVPWPDRHPTPPHPTPPHPASLVRINSFFCCCLKRQPLQHTMENIECFKLRFVNVYNILSIITIIIVQLPVLRYPLPHCAFPILISFISLSLHRMANGVCYFNILTVKCLRFYTKLSGIKHTLHTYKHTQLE